MIATDINNVTNNIFNGLFGKVKAGDCRLTVNGDIAVKTKDGYKSYNTNTGRLVNCANFVFNIGDDFFFVIPTNKVKKGDIVLISGKPKCIIEANKNVITAIDYESSEIKQIIPERHVFMGNIYFYGKIVSMFGSTEFMKGKKGSNKILQFLMMNEMMKGMNGGENNTNVLSSMLPFMMMNGNGMENLFGGMFNFDLDEDDDESLNDEEDQEEEKPLVKSKAKTTKKGGNN